MRIIGNTFKMEVDSGYLAQEIERILPYANEMDVTISSMTFGIDPFIEREQNFEDDIAFLGFSLKIDRDEVIHLQLELETTEQITISQLLNYEVVYTKINGEEEIEGVRLLTKNMYIETFRRKIVFRSEQEFYNHMLGVFQELDALTPDPFTLSATRIEDTIGSMKAVMLIFKEKYIDDNKR